MITPQYLLEKYQKIPPWKIALSFKGKITVNGNKANLGKEFFQT
jgi:hypothetical protein